MKKKKEYSELKKRAMLAKQRLKMGYWQKMQEERQQLLHESDGSVENERRISELQRDQYKRETMRAVDTGAHDREEQLYRRICEILDADEETTSPIGQLIDRTHYDTLDENGRQRYVLELSKKFRELSERYYKERSQNKLG